MPFCERRAYFEFVGKHRVIITTWLDQKTFDLSEEFALDLITLKKYPAPDWPVVNPPSPFFVNFYFDSEEENYGGEIYAQIKENDVDCIGLVDWKQHNKQLFKIKVWMDK